MLKNDIIVVVSNHKMAGKENNTFAVKVTTNIETIMELAKVHDIRGINTNISFFKEELVEAIEKGEDCWISINDNGVHYTGFAYRKGTKKNLSEVQKWIVDHLYGDNVSAVVPFMK